MNKWQLNKIINLLSHVQNKVGFYKEIIGEKSIEDLRDYEIEELFARLPIIDKKIIRTRMLDFIDDDIRIVGNNEFFSMNKDHKREYCYQIAGKTVITEFTTGSSGTPFISLKTKSERIKLGRSLWKKREQYFPIHPENMFKFIHNDGFSYPFPFEKKLDIDQRLLEELKYLSESESYWWHINTYKLEEYARVSEKYGIKEFGVKVIENNGSFISDLEVQKYEELFRCKVANNYGCREVWNIAFSCKNNHLHINEDSIYFELIDKNGEVIKEPNIVGEVVVTSYNQYTMPFIRYNLGDKAMYVENKCDIRTKQIVLLPERVQIVGTNLNGNDAFGRVILELPLWYNICIFDEISVTQIDIKKFVVNVKGFNDNREYFEKSFYKISQYIFKHNNYSYEFRYVEHIDAKSLFCVRV